MRCPVWVVASLGLLSGLGSVAPQRAGGEPRHMGVASCASSVCHGKSAPQVGRDVLLNEYSIWTHNDRHSQAYNRLKSDSALRIGAKLGIANPAAAKICVTCHADTQATDATGPTRFRQSDGVGCEACHGGAEHWLDSHAQASATHKDNLARGMYPSDQPLRRAALCLSCHLGTRDRFATHVIMGAGHPRLSFELETYTELQPRHYEVDDDYIRRKGSVDGMNLWVTGQLESAERYLELLTSPLLTAGGMTPELSFYDCYSCHHSLEDRRWSRERAGSGLMPGMLRLQRQSFVVLQGLASVISPAGAVDLKQGTEELMRAGQTNPTALQGAATRLRARLGQYESWSTRKYSPTEIAQVRKALVRLAAEDEASDFTVAEQVVMGVESLSYTLKDNLQRKSALDLLFEKVKSGTAFNAGQFAETARKLQAQF
jgi:Cytochrome c554 and c-prime